MRFIGREARPWFGGVISVVAGAAVLLVMLSAPSLKYAAVECVNTALAYPEKPALYIRNIVKLSGNWVLERATLNERVERLELERQALAEALQAYHNLTEDLVTATAPQTLTLSRRAFELWGMEAALSQVESRFPDSFPLCVKPASGSSAHGVSRVEDAEQLAEALREAFGAQVNITSIDSAAYERVLLHQ